jgi:hypothetical protein
MDMFQLMITPSSQCVRIKMFSPQPLSSYIQLDYSLIISLKVVMLLIWVLLDRLIFVFEGRFICLIVTVKHQD